MNTVSEIIDLIKSKINNSYASINDINKLAEEVYSHILAKYPEIPYFLITDIIGRMYK
jgi:hypothetical protein